ncbi:MAG: hypothetical protein K6B67_02190 [Lachnospiraceae bacterium]|nr:hypothetical protein [Lachnospiraceae bacterium]
MNIGGIGSRSGMPYFVQRTREAGQAEAVAQTNATESVQATDTFAAALENAGTSVSELAQSDAIEETSEVSQVAEAGRPLMDLGIGFLFIGDYGIGLHATQISNPNSDDVIVRVSMAQTDETMDVNVSKVDPTQASAVEMFAFCQYADATGTGVDDKWGSWHALKFFASPMEALEYKSYNDAMYKKQDWTMALAGNADYSLKSQSTGEILDVYDVFKMLKSTLVEQHKLTAKDTKAEDDWREMEDEKWKKLIERIDGYINSSIDELKQIKEEQDEAATKAAMEAPADMKSRAVSRALALGLSNI